MVLDVSAEIVIAVVALVAAAIAREILTYRLDGGKRYGT